MAEGTQGFNISNVIDEKLIALDLDVNTKEEMLNALTDLFEEQGKLNDREGFFKDVMWREGEGQTGIGMGVARQRAGYGCHPVRRYRGRFRRCAS